MKKTTFLKTFLVVVCLLTGTSVWATDLPYNVGTEGTGDAWASRKYSDAYEIAPGEIYHFTFTNTSYGSNNWNNWLLDCKATADTSVEDWYFTMRSDNYGWGASYNATMRYADFVWADFQTVMNGATVDMYVDYNATDKIIRTYTTITKSATEWHYNFASKAIDQSSVFLFLSEELAVLNLTTAEKVASLPDGTYGIYKRSVTNGYGYTWDINTSNPDYTGWTSTNGTKSLDLTDGIKWTGNNKSTGSVATTISPSEGCILNIEAEFFLKGITGSSDTRPDEAYFRFGNIIIYEDAQYNKLSYVLDGTTTVSSSGNPIGTTFFTGNNTNVRNTGVSFKILMEINTTTNVMTSMTVYTHGDLVTPKLNLSDIVLSSPNYTDIAVGFIRTRSDGNPIANLKNITVTETPQSVTIVDYTVKFQDAIGTELKADVVHDNGVVGDVYQATATDMATFYNNADESLATKKYVYKSGQNTSVVATSNAADNVITLVFDVYDKTAYTVNAQAGGSDIKTGIASGNAYLDGSTTAYWSKYLKVSDQWYVADETTYGAGITDATTNVAYTTTDAIDYFFEFEDMDDNSAILDALSGTAISGGTSKRFNANGKKWTTALAGGIYTLDLYCYGNNGKSVTMPLYYSDADGSNPVYIGEATACTASAWGLKTTTNVVIPDGKALCFFNNSSYTHNYIVDYLTLKRTGDATVSATITDAGWSTFASPYALDLSSMTASAGTVTAYYASAASGSSVTLTVTTATVPAGEGIMLKGTASATITIPVAASGTAISGNLLKGQTTTGNVAASTAGTYHYVFGFKTLDPSEYGFYKLTAATEVAAGKAYLETTGELAGARIAIVFDDNDATAISEAKSQLPTANSQFFDLQGRRVAQPTKGLYIVNGKKVIVK